MLSDPIVVFVVSVHALMSHFPTFRREITKRRKWKGGQLTSMAGQSTKSKGKVRRESERLEDKRRKILALLASPIG